MIKQVLDWAPSIEVAEGLKRTYDWIEKQVANARKNGSKEDFSKSKIVQQDERELDTFSFDV